MARPRKPKAGTVERFRKDLAANWPVYDFIEERLRTSGRDRGALAAAKDAAATRFGISVKTAERRWKRIASTMTPSLEMSLYLPDMEAASDEIERAFAGITFTPSEQRELHEISLPIARKIAAVINAQRIDIERLRKPRRKRT